MGNMSYCRFNNTAQDLNDCLYALSEENEYEISKDEIKKGIQMFDEFLGFCENAGIIDGYEFGEIERIFTEHNEMVQEQNDLTMG